MKKYSKVIFRILLLVAYICLFAYFYRSADRYDISDLAPHVEASKLVFTGKPIVTVTDQRVLPVSYLLFHVCTKILSYICAGNYELAAALVLTLFVALSHLVLVRIGRRVINTHYSEMDDWFLFGLLFMTALPLLGKFYLPQGSPSVWHSPTYLVMKPFGLLSFWYFLEVLKGHDENRSLILFAATSVLACYGKPVFAVVFLPVAGVFTLVQMIRSKSLGIGLKLLCAVFPTLLLLFWQFTQTFATSVGTVIHFGTFMNLSVLKSALATIAVVALPAIYAYCVKCKFKDPLGMKLSWCTYGIGWLQYYFLQEQGYAHGNFAWGYFMSIFVLYVFTYLDMRRDGSFNKSVLTLYLVQILSGLAFFGAMLLMHSYFM